MGCRSAECSREGTEGWSEEQRSQHGEGKAERNRKAGETRGAASAQATEPFSTHFPRRSSPRRYSRQVERLTVTRPHDGSRVTASRAEGRDDSEVVAREDSVDRFVAADLCVEGLTAMLVVGLAHEDVVDAPLLLV